MKSHSNILYKWELHFSEWIHTTHINISNKVKLIVILPDTWRQIAYIHSIQPE